MGSLTRQSLTEVDLYDTSMPCDSATGLHPLRAKIRHRSGSEAKATAQEVESQQVEGVRLEDVTYDAGTLDELVVESEKKPPWGWSTVAWIVGAVGVLMLVVLLVRSLRL